MATKRQPSGQPGSSQASVRGVQLIDRPGRPNPFGVQWPERVFDPVKGEERRKRTTMFFRTAEARDTKARDIRDQRRSRMLSSNVSRQEIEEFRAFKAAAGSTPWQDIIAGWRARLNDAGLSECTLTVEKAAKIYLDRAEALLLREKLSKGHVRHMKHKVDLFVEQFGDMILDRVKPSAIEEWIEDFPEIESDFTFDNYKKHIRAFYGHFTKTKVIRDNPASAIEHRSDGVGEVALISVAQTAQLFETCRTMSMFKPIIGRLAMEAFVGLRFASGCRLEKCDINREDKGVTLPKFKLKTKRRHYIDGLPENVWSWIDITPDSCWKLTPRQYMQLKSDLFIAARVPHPHNCLRHGFATYHVAAYKNPGLTAYILCHRNQEQLFEHYKGRATAADGALYQLITPQTAGQMSIGFQPAQRTGDQAQETSIAQDATQPVQA
jgi:integrase